MAKVIVVGAGVVGLTTALALAERGYQICVVSKEPYYETTSAVAAAFWYPYKAFPEEKVAVWGATTFEKFERLATTVDTGVSWVRLVQVTDQLDPPWWSQTVRNFSYVKDGELPGRRGVGFAFETFVIDSSVYLTYLHRRLEALGVEFKFQLVQSFNSLLADVDEGGENVSHVLNCSGLGARSLAGDADLHPARGQVVKIKKQAGDTAILDARSPTHFSHFIPRTADIILGGTYEEGIEDRLPSAEETQAIIERCKLLAPRLYKLSGDDVIQASCGLRPVRSSVRLEREELPNGRSIIHNYGHGGAGYTLSWGCAFDVLNMM